MQVVEEASEEQALEALDEAALAEATCSGLSREALNMPIHCPLATYPALLCEELLAAARDDPELFQLLRGQGVVQI